MRVINVRMYHDQNRKVKSSPLRYGKNTSLDTYLRLHRLDEVIPSTLMETNAAEEMEKNGRILQHVTIFHNTSFFESTGYIVIYLVLVFYLGRRKTKSVQGPLCSPHL